MSGQGAADFIAAAVQNGALSFGDFTLKSGRRSPYFFNTGAFLEAGSEALQQLGEWYAEAIREVGLDSAEVAFGPAYKGIPLAYCVQQALPLRVTFNRKETKDHGEGGALVGAALEGRRVLLIDDVITAGTAVAEIAPLIAEAGGELIGIVVALDRQELGKTGEFASTEIASALGIPVASIAGVEDLVDHLEQVGDNPDDLERLQMYRFCQGLARQVLQGQNLLQKTLGTVIGPLVPKELQKWLDTVAATTGSNQDWSHVISEAWFQSLYRDYARSKALVDDLADFIPGAANRPARD